MKKLILSIFSVVVLLGLASPVMAASESTFDPVGDACKDKNAQNSQLCKDQAGDSSNPITGKDGIIIKVTNLVALVTGVIAVVIIIYAGFRFITGGSNSDSVRAAREMLIFAVVGLVVIVFARTIIVFVADKLL